MFVGDYPEQIRRGELLQNIGGSEQRSFARESGAVAAEQCPADRFDE
jgi:hypothetical protein